MEPKAQSVSDKETTLPLLTIQQYCNNYSIDDMYSFIFCKSFSSIEPRSKQDWDLFLQDYK